MLFLENQKPNKMDDNNDERLKSESELLSSKDEVDFVQTSTVQSTKVCLPCTKNVNTDNDKLLTSSGKLTNGKTINNNNNINNNNSKSNNNNNNKSDVEKSSQTTTTTTTTTPIKNDNLTIKQRIPGTLFGDCDVRSTCPVKSSLSSLEKLHIFNFHPRKKSDPSPSTIIKDKPKFVKSASIARLFGNTYSTKRTEQQTTTNVVQTKINNNERFHKSTQENGGDELQIKDFNETHDMDLSAKAMRTLTRGLGRLLRRRTSSVDISEPDPEFKVAYLGNVLTGWAKGDGCVEKPLATLWRNYTQNSKPDVIMKIRVCSSGLKATTKQHGLTEYWSHRITHCSSPKNYPRVFCWVYRHEGRKLKHEMRCHAVLCSKEAIAKDVGKKLQENIARALREFKRDKISRQNARLSLVNSVYDNPSMPRRKILLSVGGNNYRPPLERSKSAPKLMAIEEMVGEEDEEEEEEYDENGQTKEKCESRPCCIEDSLYPAMTLGRRRCRRGHSIRRTGRRSLMTKRETPKLGPGDPTYKSLSEDQTQEIDEVKPVDLRTDELNSDDSTKNDNRKERVVSTISTESEEDFVGLYDSSEPLEGEIMSYFDMKLKPTTASLSDLHENQTNSLLRNTQSLDDLDNYSDIEPETPKEVFFNQNDILEILRSQALKPRSPINHDIDGYTDHSKTNSFDSQYSNLTPEAASDCDSSIKSDTDLAYIKINTFVRGRLTDDKLIQTNNKKSEHYFNLMMNEKSKLQHQQQQMKISTMTTSIDESDEIETPPPSILTVKNGNLLSQMDSDEGSISSGCETSSTVTTNADEQQQITTIKMNLDDNDIVILEPVGEKGRIEYRRSITYPTSSKESYELNVNKTNNDSDSEFSDESGYVEYQESNECKTKSVIV